MKRSNLIFVVTVLIIGLLAAGCSNGGENKPPSNDMNDSISNDADNGVPNEDEDLPEGDLPGAPIVEGPIVNLPGEIPYQDQERGEGQAKLVSGNAFVSSTDLVIMESYPVQVALEISGELPTPCNQLTVDIAAPDGENQIHVKVYSLIDPAMTCMQVIEPFNSSINLPVEDLADGTYEVWVNGTMVGEFTYPG